jgi:predicted nicotinamide N-methyase
MTDVSASVTKLRIPGGWQRRSIRVEGRQFELTLPADPNQLLDELAESEDEGQAPPPVYWAALWSASLPTAAAVLRGTWQQSRRALEIGCGIGLVGLAGLAAGLDVTFSDAIPTAAQLALENARQNGFRNASSSAFDWRAPPATRFPVILASDVLYDRSDHPLLVGLLNRTLTGDGIGWIGDPGRAHVPQFIDRAEQAGLSVQLFDTDDQPLASPRVGAYQRLVISRRSRP